MHAAYMQPTNTAHVQRACSTKAALDDNMHGELCSLHAHMSIHTLIHMYIHTYTTFAASLAVSFVSLGWGLLKYPALISCGGFGLDSSTAKPPNQRPTFSMHEDYNLYDIGFFVLIGIAGGLLGSLFNGANHSLTLWRFKHVPTANPCRRQTTIRTHARARCGQAAMHACTDAPAQLRTRTRSRGACTCPLCGACT